MNEVIAYIYILYYSSLYLFIFRNYSEFQIYTYFDVKLIFNHSFLRTKDKAPSAKGEERTPPHLKSLYKKSQKTKNKSKSFNVIISAL